MAPWLWGVRHSTKAVELRFEGTHIDCSTSHRTVFDSPGAAIGTDVIDPRDGGCHEALARRLHTQTHFQPAH